MLCQWFDSMIHDVIIRCQDLVIPDAFDRVNTATAATCTVVTVAVVVDGDGVVVCGDVVVVIDGNGVTWNNRIFMNAVVDRVEAAAVVAVDVVGGGTDVVVDAVVVVVVVDWGKGTHVVIREVRSDCVHTVDTSVKIPDAGLFILFR